MKVNFLLMLLAFALLSVLTDSQDRSTSATPGNSTGNTFYTTHVTLIDTEAGTEAQDRTAAISGDRVSEVAKSGDVDLSVGGKVVDGTGKFPIPGFWDMHEHAVRSDRMASRHPRWVRSLPISRAAASWTCG